MRNHYEHWDKMGQFYKINLDRPQLIPRKDSDVEKYLQRYRTNAKESPKGYYSIDYEVQSESRIQNIIIGGALNLGKLKIMLDNLNRKVKKIDTELRNQHD